jgi:hypothetical protein
MWETGGENVSLPRDPRNDRSLSPEGTCVVHMSLHRSPWSDRPPFMPHGPFHG